MEQVLYELPKGWRLISVGEVCNKVTDGAHHTPKYVLDGIPFLSVKDISKGKVDFSNTRFVDQETHNQLFKRCNPEYGDLLYTKVGTTGIAKVNDTKKEFSLFVSVALLKPKNDLIKPYFFEYMLNSPDAYEQAQSRTRGVANRNLVLRDIKNIVIPLPPLNEQKRIVAKLDALFTRIDTAITHLQQTLDLTKALFASALDEIFEQAAQDSDAKPIEEIFVISSGDGLTQKQMIKDGSYDVYGGNGITGRHNDFNRSGTNVVIGRVGAWCGNVRLVEGDIWVTDNAFFVKSYLANVFAPYLVAVLQHLDLRKTANQAAQPVISYKGIRELLIPLPSIGEQQRIVTHLDALSESTRALEAATQEKLNDLATLKTSLLDAAFKGQLMSPLNELA